MLDKKSNHEIIDFINKHVRSNNYYVCYRVVNNIINKIHLTFYTFDIFSKKTLTNLLNQLKTLFTKVIKSDIIMIKKGLNTIFIEGFR